jgi:hypothetical protein
LKTKVLCIEDKLKFEFHLPQNWNGRTTVGKNTILRAGFPAPNSRTAELTELPATQGTVYIRSYQASFRRWWVAFALFVDKWRSDITTA